MIHSIDEGLLLTSIDFHIGTESSLHCIPTEVDELFTAGYTIQVRVPSLNDSNAVAMISL